MTLFEPYWPEADVGYCVIYDSGDCPMWCDRTMPSGTCTEMPSGLDFSGPNDPEALQGASLGPDWEMTGLDITNTPIPSGDPIGAYVELPCGIGITPLAPTNRIVINYIGPQPIIDFSIPWSFRLAGIPDTNNDISAFVDPAPLESGDDTQYENCNHTPFTATLGGALGGFSRAEFDKTGFCPDVLFECVASGIRERVTRTSFGIPQVLSKVGVPCCMAMEMDVDGCNHSIDFSVESVDAGFINQANAGDPCELRWNNYNDPADYPGGVFPLGLIEFNMSGDDWNVEQLPWYRCPDFIPFPTFIGTYTPRQTARIEVETGTFFTQFCIQN